LSLAADSIWLVLLAAFNSEIVSELDSLLYRLGAIKCTFSSFATAKIQKFAFGHHYSLSITLLLSLYFLTILLVLTHQITTFESSSPEARKAPFGETAIDLTQVVWKL